MQKFYYVYILVDITTETHHYTGVTEDLHARLGKPSREQAGWIDKAEKRLCNRR